MTRLSQEAITAAKKLRSQTDIGRRTVSISHTAVSLAKRMFHDLTACRFLIIGTGEMGRVAAEYAHSYNPKNLIIANRTVSKAQVIAQSLGRETVFGLDELPSLLKQVDVVIVATASHEYIVTHEMILNLRRSESIKTPLFLIDIAMPRNIDPACSTADDVYLFDIDDLKQVIDQNKTERQNAAMQGEEIVVQAAQVFCQWVATQKLVPVMEAWRQHVATTLSREAQKTLAKDIFSQLNSDQRKALEQMFDSITAKLSGDLSQSLRNAPGDEALILAKSVGQIFGLEVPRSLRKENVS
jgi:glutamyl-tRNA reductase